MPNKLVINDPRFSMPSLFQRGRKPVGRVKIDKSHPLAKGLVLCVVGEVDLVNNFVVDRVGSVMTRGNIEHDDTADYTTLEENIDSIMPVSEISIALGYEKTDATNRSSGTFGFNDTSLESNRCGAHTPSTDGVVYFDFGGLSSGRASKAGLTFGDDNWVFSSSVSKNVMYIVQNGDDVGATTGTALTRTRSTTHKFTFGFHRLAQSDLAEYKYMYVYDRQLSIEECRSLDNNPYQFLIPDTPPIRLFASTDIILSDPRFEMPSLFYRGRKPVGNIKIDWNNKLTKGLVGFWMMDEFNTDLTGNNKGTSEGDLTKGYKINGSYMSVTDDNTSDGIGLGSIDYNNPLNCSVNNEISILSILETSATSTPHGNDFPRLIDKSDAVSGANGYGVYANYSSNGFQFIIDTSVDLVVSSENMTTSAYKKVGITHISGDSDIFIDGSLDSHHTILTTPIPSTTTNAAIGNWNHDIDRQYRLPIYLNAVWDIKLTNAQMISMQNNPYQFLIPA